MKQRLKRIKSWAFGEIPMSWYQLMFNNIEGDERSVATDAQKRHAAGNQIKKKGQNRNSAPFKIQYPMKNRGKNTL